MNIWCVESRSAGENDKRASLAKLIGDPIFIPYAGMAALAKKHKMDFGDFVDGIEPHDKTRSFIHDMADGFGIPDIIVASGAQKDSLLTPVAAKLFGDVFWANVGVPRHFEHLPDLVLMQAWSGRDRRVPLEKSYFAKGVPHQVSVDVLNEQREKTRDLFADCGDRKKILLLLGGEINQTRNSEQIFDDAFFEEIVAFVKREIKAGHQLIISNSKRTPDDFWERLKRKKTFQTPPVFVEFNHPGSHTYLTMLAHADAIVVTADSKSMLWQTAATDKPLYTIVPWIGKETPPLHQKNLDIMLNDGRVKLPDAETSILATAKVCTPMNVSAEFGQAAMEAIQRWLPNRAPAGFHDSPRIELIRA